MLAEGPGSLYPSSVTNSLSVLGKSLFYLGLKNQTCPNSNLAHKERSFVIVVAGHTGQTVGLESWPYPLGQPCPLSVPLFPHLQIGDTMFLIKGLL